MKAFTGLLAILLLGGIQGEEQSQPGKGRSCVNFAGELYQRVRKSLPEDESFVISPLGVSSLLGTLLFAVNQTAGTEIYNFLYPKCASSSENTPRPSIPQRQGSFLTMATVAMVRRGISVDKRFKENAAELDSYVYKTGFWSYEEDLNQLIFNKTNDRSFHALGGVLRDDDKPDASTRLVFFNSLRFMAKFKQEFSSVERNQIGKGVQALYADVAELKARVLGLPLLNTTAILLILVPNEGVNLRSVERGLRKVDVRKLPSKLNPKTMDITLDYLWEPKYLLLRDALQRAGITSVFNEKTEMIAFNGEVPLDNVLVFSGIEFSYDGINTGYVTDFQFPNADIRKADSVTYPEFKALGTFLYAVADSEHVYLLGRRF